MLPILGFLAKPIISGVASAIVRDQLDKNKEEGAQKTEDQPKSPNTNADF